MAVGVAGRLDHRRPPVIGHAQVDLGQRGGHGCIDGDLHVAVQRVLEADRHGEAAGQLAVGRALRGAGSDGRPADRIGQEVGHQGSTNSQPTGRSRERISSRRARAARIPSLIRFDPSSRGSGSVPSSRPRCAASRSRYAYTMQRSSATRSAWSASRLAYSRPAIGSWIEQGPTTTRRRSSVPLEDRPDGLPAPPDGVEMPSGQGSSWRTSPGRRSGWPWTMVLPPGTAWPVVRRSVLRRSVTRWWFLPACRSTQW